MRLKVSPAVKLRTMFFVAGSLVLVLAPMRPSDGATVSPVPRETIVRGVNQPDLGWMSPGDATSALSQMKAASIQSVRIVLTPPYEKSLSVVAKATEIGLSVLLNINLNYQTYYEDKGLGVKVGHNVAWPLSKISASRFREELRKILEICDADGLRLTGLELGNEINWAGFNSDLLPSPQTQPEGNGLESADSKMKSSMVGYKRALSVLQELRNQSKLNSKAPIIFGGLATVTDEVVREHGGGYVAPLKTLEIARRSQVVSAIDGVAIHFYPSLGATPPGIDEMESEAIEYCHAAAMTCWVTEMGVALPSSTSRDQGGWDATYMNALDKLYAAAPNMDLAGIYLFEWHDSHQPYSVWNGSELATPASSFFSRSRQSD